MCSVEGCILVAFRGLGPSLDVHGEESDKILSQIAGLELAGGGCLRRKQV